ncbi:hypothetical protein [Streptomyces sp. NPDC058371]|uniref:hypothetical protein n=1 Tax=Streptomyces sp. NPDC058371 TaxID=3346463 RepID=UPI00365C6EDA
MAQAAPTSGTPRTPGKTDRATGTPGVLSPRASAAVQLALPVVLGLVYGFWAAAIRRDTHAITGWNVLFGFVCAIAFGAVWAGLRMMAPRMRREVHALLWFAFAGISFGFLYSQTGATILRSVLMSIGIGAAVFAVLFYRYYTHEDAEGRPNRS